MTLEDQMALVIRREILSNPKRYPLEIVRAAEGMRDAFEDHQRTKKILDEGPYIFGNATISRKAYDRWVVAYQKFRQLLPDICTKNVLPSETTTDDRGEDARNQEPNNSDPYK